MLVIRRLLARARRFVHWRQSEQELAEELEVHRALLQADLEASGLTRSEARAASFRRLGNLTLASEECRRIWLPLWLEQIGQDARCALRAFKRSRGLATSIVVVSTLGIGATTSVFGLISALVLRPLPVQAPGQLVYFDRPSFSFPIFTEVRSRGRHIFSDLFAWHLERRIVDWNTELESAEVLAASGNFHATLGVTASIGRTLDTFDDRIGGGEHGLVAVISDASWERRFGRDPSVIGKVIRIDRQPFTIVGVTPRGFFGVAPGLAPEVTIPLTSLQTVGALSTPSSAWLHLMGRLRDGVDLHEANAALVQFWPVVLEVTTAQGMPADRRARYLARQTSLVSGRAGYSRIRNQFEAPLWTLLALVGLLLAVACGSAANLLLARGVARRREVAVRLAIGASRARVVRQMLTESLVWTVFGAAAGVIIGTWSAGAIVSLLATWEDPIVLEITPGWPTIAAAAVLAICSAAVSVAPALSAVRPHPWGALKLAAAESVGWRGAWWWSGRTLVALQVALSVLLLAGAALFVRSLLGVLGEDSGIDRDRITLVATDPRAAGHGDGRLAAFYAQLLSRLQSIPGVESASLSQYPPISQNDGAWTHSVGIDGAVPTLADGQPPVFFNAVSPRYFLTLGMPLLAGRDIAWTDAAGAQRVVVINQSLARRFFPNRNPIGRRVSVGTSELRRNLLIIGIVADAKYRFLQEPSASTAYLSCAQIVQCLDENLWAEVRTAAGLPSIGEQARREARALLPGVPIRVQTVEQRIRESLVAEHVVAALAATLGIAATALACASLYGMLAYAVARRGKEIGVRLALGAARQAILRMVLRECLSVTAIGVGLGLAASVAFGGVARARLHDIEGTDPWALSAAAVLMFGMAGLAGLVPANRAANVDPVVALRPD